MVPLTLARKGLHQFFRNRYVSACAANEIAVERDAGTGVDFWRPATLLEYFRLAPLAPLLKGRYL